MTHGDPIIDVDNHYYETDDCFTRYLDPAFRDRAVHIVRDSDGPGRPYLGDQPMYFLVSNPADWVGRPGAVVQRKDERYEPLPPEEMIRPSELPELATPDGRLSWMDSQDIDSVLLFPGLALTVEHQLHDDPAVCIANMAAFNRWLDDEWGFSYRDRVFGVPFLTLVDLDAAVVELEWVLGRKARAVHLLFAPVDGRSIADPHFDPFWARLAESGVPVCFHGCNSGYSELFSVAWGEDARPPAHAQSAFRPRHVLRRAPDHGHVGLPYPAQPLRPVSGAPGDEYRERFGVGLLPVASDGPRRDDGGPWPVARRSPRGSPERGLPTPRIGGPVRRRRHTRPG